MASLMSIARNDRSTPPGKQWIAAAVGIGRTDPRRGVFREARAYPRRRAVPTIEWRVVMRVRSGGGLQSIPAVAGHMSLATTMVTMHAMTTLSSATVQVHFRRPRSLKADRLRPKAKTSE